MNNFIEVNKNTQIYVLCPAYFKTGGTELLHQLVYWLQYYNIAAHIVYTDATKEKNINPAFKQYVNAYLNFKDIIDSKENICILPEIFTNYARQIKQSRKVIWWESVDNYLFESSVFYNLKFANFRKALHIIKRRLLRKECNQLSIKELRKVDYHLVQSYYAKDFAKNNKFNNILYLSDYINDIYIKSINQIDFSKKQDLVCYNPKKGKKFTSKILQKAINTNIKFVPIINMTNEEVRDLLTKAKVYIDFGEHPGKDRFPREAAASFCCIITGKKGAAQFYDDVKIPDKYKFKDKRKNIRKIWKQINYCVDFYESAITDFENYRSYIADEKDYFKQCIANIFQKHKS